MTRLRPFTETDLDDVLALNARNVAALAPMDQLRLRELEGWSDRFDVLDVQGAFAGFVITFPPGTEYDSVYYSWFTEQFGEAFYYLDRIVLHEDFRRQGLGSFVYDEIEAVAARRGRITLEVNVRPRNDGSLAFHGGRGYAEVGRIDSETKTVALMEKRL